MKRRVIIITELFYPEENSTAYILTKLANRLAEKYQVLVICGPEFYQKGNNLNRGYINPDIEINRISLPNLNKDKLLSRTLRMILITVKLFCTLCRYRKKNDILFSVTNPAPLLLLLSFLRRFVSNPYCLLVHDVFPENTVPAGILKPSDWSYRILKKIFDAAYRQASVLVVLGRDMKLLMMKKLKSNPHHTKIEIVENWAEVDLVYPNLKNTEQLEINLQYAGNLGRVQGLMGLLEIVKSVQNPYLKFSFWGKGAMKKKMEAYVASNQMNNVLFYDAFKRNEQNDVLAQCDLAIVTLAPGMCGLGVPSKTYNIMAAGKPILFLGDAESEVSLMIEESNIGYSYSMNDKDGILEFFNSLTLDKLAELQNKGKQARVLAEKKFSEEVILEKYVNLFDKMM